MAESGACRRDNYRIGSSLVFCLSDIMIAKREI
jgi:hypothetical protein